MGSVVKDRSIICCKFMQNVAIWSYTYYILLQYNLLLIYSSISSMQGIWVIQQASKSAFCYQPINMRNIARQFCVECRQTRPILFLGEKVKWKFRIKRQTFHNVPKTSSEGSLRKVQRTSAKNVPRTSDGNVPGTSYKDIPRMS